VKLSAVRSFALSLPEVMEQPHFHFGSFRVRGKIFVTLPPGDELLHVFAAETQREQALAMYPAWTDNVLWGGKVVAVRVALPKAPASAVKALVRQAWEHKAPKSLLKSTMSAPRDDAATW
jgi:hypothetical protein